MPDNSKPEGPSAEEDIEPPDEADSPGSGRVEAVNVDDEAANVARDEHDDAPDDQTQRNETPRNETPRNETPRNETPHDKTPHDQTQHDETPHDEGHVGDATLPATETDPARAASSAPTEPSSTAPITAFAAPPAQPPATEAPARRKRPHLVLRCLIAVVAGAVIGAGAGYGVQAQRPPTPLPPLAQPQPKQPRLSAGATLPPLPASQDEQVAFDTNLAGFLLPLPKGAKDITAEFGGTMPTFLDYSENAYSGPSGGFNFLNSARVMSISQRSWLQNHVQVWDVLFRYSDALGTSQASSEVNQDAINAAPEEGEPITTSMTNWGEGSIAVYPHPHASAHGDYQGFAAASHGDIEMYIVVDSDRPVTTSLMENLGNEQWGRL